MKQASHEAGLSRATKMHIPMISNKSSARKRQTRQTSAARKRSSHVPDLQIQLPSQFPRGDGVFQTEYAMCCWNL